MVDVPPPPENPFMSENPEVNYTPIDEAETLDQGRPTVSSTPGKVIIILAGVAVLVLVLLYNIFTGGKKDSTPAKQEKARPVAPPPVLDPPVLPSTPLPVTPTLPPIVPPTIPPATDLQSLQILKPEDNGAAKQQATAHMQSKLMVSDGNAGALNNLLSSDKKAADVPAGGASDPNAAFGAKIMAANTTADRVMATQIGDLRHTIAQGRIIEATMESAMNTDLPAPIRAIVSRDTFAEAGNEALIPKGSRLIGTYNTDISGGQSRIFVVWTRVIRPDGVDVMINSPLVDQIGQAGVGGQVDTKFQSIFSRSILSSIVSIAFAIGSDKVSGGSTTTTSSAVGGSSTTGDAATTATVSALDRLGNVSDSFLQRFIDSRPTILVDQGTPVNVFVNHDLVFPAEYSPGGAKIIN